LAWGPRRDSPFAGGFWRAQKSKGKHGVGKSGKNRAHRRGSVHGHEHHDEHHEAFLAQSGLDQVRTGPRRHSAAACHYFCIANRSTMVKCY
jgi:hypothetical protein